MADNFVQRTLDALLEVVEVEFKIPLGFAEIKFPVTAHAKKWWKNKKNRLELEQAIQRAEEKFIEANKDQRVAQMLRELPLYSEGEFKLVIANLLTHLSEEKITWLVEVQLTKTWGNVASGDEIRKALELYLPYLRHELNAIPEFREVISALTLERIEKKADSIDQKTYKIDKTTQRIEYKLDEALKVNKLKPIALHTGWFFGHRYGDLESFTGRTAELKILNDWLNNDKNNLLMIRALGGFGKSALAWTWFNSVDREKWQTAVWWSFYEKESGFENFLSETLKHLGVEVKESARQQLNDLLDVMHKTNILIVLDGFERLLRQYGKMDAALQSDDEDEAIDPSQRDCASPLTETFLRGLSGENIGSKVLMTTRLCPRVLESADGKLLKGCRDELLQALSPDDAMTYFHNERIAATRAEIIAVCSAYGYHPLSLSLLVGLINEDHEHRGDIVVARNLDIFGDIKTKRFHVLQRAYESLAPERRDLLSKISCFRGSMGYAVLKKVFSSADLDKSLLDLRKRGLLQYAGENQRYDMHPIVRHYAYDHFTDEKLRKEAHVGLVMHFIDAIPVTNKNVKSLEDLAPIIELYHHMVRAGNLDEAFELFYDRLSNALHYQFGAYQLCVELLCALFLDGEDKPSRLKRESSQAWTLSTLATAYSMSGQPRRATPLYEMQLTLQEKIGNKNNLARGLGAMALQQINIGALKEAERNLRRSLDLCKEIDNKFEEASGHSRLARIFITCGLWNEAEQELSIFLETAIVGKFVQMQGAAWIYRAIRFLLMERATPQYPLGRMAQIENLKSSVECAHRAVELAESGDPNIGGAVVPRDLVRSRWLLGSAYRVNNELTLAEENLFKALNLCRQINLVDHEADILLDLARLHYAQNDFQDAQEKASEALTITERSGYVLQGADVNLFLAQYVLEQEKNKVKAKEYAEEAKKLAYCDGPPYYYKVAYEEAERMLERLKVLKF